MLAVPPLYSAAKDGNSSHKAFSILRLTFGVETVRPPNVLSPLHLVSQIILGSIALPVPVKDEPHDDNGNDNDNAHVIPAEDDRGKLHFNLLFSKY